MCGRVCERECVRVCERKCVCACVCMCVYALTSSPSSQVGKFWDPRYNFALSSGALSSPRMRVFSTAAFPAELDAATKEFVAQHVDVYFIPRHVALPVDADGSAGSGSGDSPTRAVPPTSVLARARSEPSLAQVDVRVQTCVHPVPYACVQPPRAPTSRLPGQAREGSSPAPKQPAFARSRPKPPRAGSPSRSFAADPNSVPDPRAAAREPARLLRYHVPVALCPSLPTLVEPGSAGPAGSGERAPIPLPFSTCAELLKLSRGSRARLKREGGAPREDAGGIGIAPAPPAALSIDTNVRANPRTFAGLAGPEPPSTPGAGPAVCPPAVVSQASPGQDSDLRGPHRPRSPTPRSEGELPHHSRSAHEAGPGAGAEPNMLSALVGEHSRPLSLLAEQPTPPRAIDPPHVSSAGNPPYAHLVTPTRARGERGEPAVAHTHASPPRAEAVNNLPRGACNSDGQRLEERDEREAAAAPRADASHALGYELTVVLPALFDWFAGDFGSSPYRVLVWLLRYAPLAVQVKLLPLHFSWLRFVVEPFDPTALYTSWLPHPQRTINPVTLRPLAESGSDVCARYCSHIDGVLTKRHKFDFSLLQSLSVRSMPASGPLAPSLAASDGEGSNKAELQLVRVNFASALTAQVYPAPRIAPAPFNTRTHLASVAGPRLAPDTCWRRSFANSNNNNNHTRRRRRRRFPRARPRRR